MSKTKNIALISAAAISSLMLCQSAVFADGLMNGNHVNSEYKTLTLSQDQIKALNKGATKITLTPAQRQVVTDEIAIDKVKELRILPKNTTTCTCELQNVGVRVTSKTIEVPIFLLDRSEEMSNSWDWSKRNSQQFRAEEAEIKMPHPTKEALLNKRGQELIANSPEKALALFKAAQAANPKHKWSKMNVALAYLEIGRLAMDTKPPNYAKAASNFELAMQVDPTDKLISSAAKRPLRVAKYRLAHPRK